MAIHICIACITIVEPGLAATWMEFIGSAVVTGTRTCATLVVEPVRSLRWSARVEFGCIALIIVECLRKSLMVVFQEADCDKRVPVPVAVSCGRKRQVELEASEFGIHKF